MNARRAFAFTRRTLQQFRHDRRTLGFVLGMPLLMVIIFGYTFGGEVSNIKVISINQDLGLPAGTMPNFPNGLNMGDRMDKSLSTNTLSIERTADVDAAREKVDKAQTWAVIIFPSNFTQNFIQKMAGNVSSPKPVVEIYLDGSNPNIAATFMKSINSAILSAINKLAAEMNQSSRDMPVSIERDYAYGGSGLKFIDYFAPGVISFAIMMVTTMITIILFVFEKRNGTLQRLLMSPATEGEIVFGYAMAFAVIGIIQSVVILSAAILLFGVTIQGNIFLAFFVILLLAFGHQGLGILLSAGAKNELQAIQFIPLILFPSVLLAGLFWPIESITPILQPVSWFIPLKYGIDAERSIMLRGWGIEQVWPQVLALVFFACLTLGLSVLLLKRRR